MKNKYKIIDDTVIIDLERRNGEILECKVDLEDIEKLMAFNYKWYPNFYKNNRSYYAKSTEYLGLDSNGKPKYKIHSLHKFLVDAPKGHHVDHINHDTLDNRKSNLRVITHNQNLKHRKGANRNNKTGYRNVSYSESEGKYIVQLYLNNKNTILGKFNDVHEAGTFAEKMREKYYKIN
jgi:hypothetical protein